MEKVKKGSTVSSLFIWTLNLWNSMSKKAVFQFVITPILCIIIKKKTTFNFFGGVNKLTM